MMDKMMTWWESRSRTFSRLTGESFTHGEVVGVLFAVVMLLVACGLAGRMGG